jgi:hypothetical protein
VAKPPFDFHVHSMPGAREEPGWQEPRDDASVLDGEAARAIPLGVAGVARNTARRRRRCPSSAFAKPASVSLDEPQTLAWDELEAYAPPVAPLLRWSAIAVVSAWWTRRSHIVPCEPLA